ncbi:YcbK family protein, partial [Phyllobacterium sp. P5_D12]
MKLLPASVYTLRASTVACVIVLSAMAATSCTSTVSSPGATAALAPSSDATTHTTESAMPSGGTRALTPEALALAGSTETSALQAINQTVKPANGKALPATTTAEAQKGSEQQTAATATPTQPPVKTSLFGSSTPASTEETQVASAATAAAPVKTSLFGNPMRGEGNIQPKKTPQQAAELSAADADKTAAKADDAPVSPEQGIAPETTRPATAAKNNGALMRLFSNNLSKPAGKRLVAVIEPKSQPKLRAVDTSSHAASPLPAASSFTGQTQYVSSSLPGVRPNAGIQIMQRDSLYDDDDVEAAAAPVILASAAGLARLAPNGLKVQRENVQVACLKPQLVGMLKTIERRYGKSVIVTSGYRSPPYNRLVNGAKASLHMSCAAADIQIPGVSKWELANFARSMPGRGGVGTYCHTES